MICPVKKVECSNNRCASNCGLQESSACRFCGNHASKAHAFICRNCYREVELFVSARFESSELSGSPFDSDPMSKKGLESWHQWVKRIDGGGGSYGQMRQKAIDDIFNAALIGMKKVRRAKHDLKSSVANELRKLADQVERRSE